MVLVRVRLIITERRAKRSDALMTALNEESVWTTALACVVHIGALGELGSTSFVDPRTIYLLALAVILRHCLMRNQLALYRSVPMTAITTGRARVMAVFVMWDGLALGVSYNLARSIAVLTVFATMGHVLAGQGLLAVVASGRITLVLFRNVPPLRHFCVMVNA